MRILHSKIYGQPVGIGRPRAVRRGRHVVMYTPEKTAEWEALAAAVFAADWFGQMLSGCGDPALHFRLRVLAVGARPARLAGEKHAPGRIWRATKPDGDNVLKAVGDALVASGVIKDDTQIVDWQVLCLYAAKGEEPCVEVFLEALPANLDALPGQLTLPTL